MQTTSGLEIELNEEGFLRHPEVWDREVAVALAREAEGIDALTEQHWAIVDYIRTYWLEKGMAPMVTPSWPASSSDASVTLNPSRTHAMSAATV